VKTVKPKYYSIDTGFFPQIVYLCFSDEALQQIFDENKLAVNIRAFENGQAETHVIHTHLGSLIIMVFNLGDYEDDEDESTWIGVIAHEACHAVEKLGHFVGEDDLYGETRAYITQSFVEQVYKASLIERKEHARKRDRAVSSKKRKTEEWPMSEMGEFDNGSVRQDSDAPKHDPVGRVKNGKGKSESEAEDNVSTIRAARISGRGNKV